MFRLRWRLAEQLLPLPLALYTNRKYLKAEVVTERLPSGDWARDEAQSLISDSINRLESLESKGPGLAAVCGIIAAAIALAVSLTWSEASVLARVDLSIAAAYTVLSLWTPIVLVGPIPRQTITNATLQAVSSEEVPAKALAHMKLEASVQNDREAQRLSNLQAASRNDARNATILFVLWLFLLLVGLGSKTSSPSHYNSSPMNCVRQVALDSDLVRPTTPAGTDSGNSKADPARTVIVDCGTQPYYPDR